VAVHQREVALEELPHVGSTRVIRADVVVWHDALSTPMPDALFADPRLAAVYDALEGDRRDLEAYVALVDELDARTVLDIGCGTGTFACMLAARGLEVRAVDPAEASLDVARRKPGAETVRWARRDAASLPKSEADVATMTGNVAQVFLTDEEWSAALTGAGHALRPGGALVFETRDPAREAWREWTRDLSYRRAGPVESWVDLVDVSPPLVSFRTTFVFGDDGTVLHADSTLRFRGREEVVDSLGRAGFSVEEVRDAPDRPGKEFVFIARTRAPAPPRRRTGRGRTR
jgi:SAM-dependent methyltransferase